MHEALILIARAIALAHDRWRTTIGRRRPFSGKIAVLEERVERLEAENTLLRARLRAPVALSKVFPQKDGRVKLLTPRNPETGQDSRLFDPLDWIHAISTQIPDARQHLVRHQGAYANRVRRLYRPDVGEKAGQGEAPTRAPEGEAEDVPEWVTQRRRSWARLLRRIYEVDPLVCPRCGDELKIVSVITDPVVVAQGGS